MLELEAVENGVDPRPLGERGIVAYLKACWYTVCQPPDRQGTEVVSMNSALPLLPTPMEFNPTYQLA